MIDGEGTTPWSNVPPARPPVPAPRPPTPAFPPRPPASVPTWSTAPSPVLAPGGPAIALRRRGPAGRAAAALVLAGVVGAGAGAVAGRLSAPSPAAAPPAAVAVASGSSAAVADLDIASVAGLADVPAIAEALEPSVVSVEVSTTVAGRNGRATTQQGAGTGFVLTADGQIATNAHVVSGATTVTVVLADGTRLPATVIGIEAAEDLAVLQVQRDDLVPVTMGSSDDLRVGETVVAMGNALALEGGFTVSMGIVSAVHRTLSVETTTYPDLVQTDAAISSGNSGGPLVDSAGRVVAINSAAATTTSAENIGFAIAIDHALPVLRALGATV